MPTIRISKSNITLDEIEKVLSGVYSIEITEESLTAVDGCRKYLDERMRNLQAPIYGINTGFGSLYNKTISPSDLESLQKNLVMSHACGTGEQVPAELVRLMLFLKIKGLCYGNSGVTTETVQRLADFFNYDVLPIVYQQGSLGASGDLAPLAHLSLPLIGLGEVYYKGALRTAEDALARHNWHPIQLKSKEGLALLNGTQFMSSYGAWAVYHANNLAHWAEVIAAISFDAFDGHTDPFMDAIQKIRPHNGQIQVANNMRNLLEGSEISKRPKSHVQDPYSFRCIPQVHGASRDAIQYVEKVILTEINSVTDNPTIFPDDDKVVSAGNFHGQPLALALDFLGIALSELGNISERRTYLLISGQRQLPPFLAKDAGLHSGFMIPQYTAASIVSKNKQLCSPASVDSIVSSNGQEDHVSMGANAATKTYTIVNNLYDILGIELLTACQALEFRRPLKSSPTVEKVFSAFRESVPFMESDRVIAPDIHKAADFIRKNRGLV
ncbi:MAG: histidine ammonia-lyase [Bacteroidota bacterium]|jgi:histidine ammonia-lyase